MKNELLNFRVAFKRLRKSILGFTDGTDIQSTIEGIHGDISFRGHHAWILIFSIIIASIGLNINSTALVIGAMLISPLMGPILGLGLAVGTNDMDTLERSLINFGIAIFISLFTSTLYFIITPLNIEQNELVARTEPTILDVVVAFVGGMAGIIAGSRKIKTNVVPGVAIATALMPPLCTAGYGLANQKWDFFFGAMYLFFINSAFITLATFIVVKYLKFPLIEQVTRKKRIRYRISISIFLTVTVIPSAIIFYSVVQKARFEVALEDFVAEKCHFEGGDLREVKFSYADTASTVTLEYYQPIDQNKQTYLEDQLTHYNLTADTRFPITRKTKLIFKPDGNFASGDIDSKFEENNQKLRITFLKDLYSKNEEILQNKEEKIRFLENELMALRKKNDLPFAQLNKELKYHYPVIESFSFGNNIEVTTVKDSVSYDTVPLFLIKMKQGFQFEYQQQQLRKVEEWLRIRLDNDKIKATQKL